MSRRRIPFVAQLELSDCGAACLAMVLAHRGRIVPLEELRAATGTGRGGVDAQSILDAARRYGLDGRGVHADLGALRQLSRGSILHWGFHHFVVLERVTRSGVVIVDPAVGRRRVSMEAFRRLFTGVAVVLEPAAGFVTGGATRRRWRHLRPLLDQLGPLRRVLLTSVLLRLLAAATPLLVAALVDRYIPLGDVRLLGVLAAAFAVVVVYQLATSLVRAHLLLQLRTHLDVRLTRGFIEHLVDLPYGFFLRRSSGDLMMRMGSTATVREILTTGALSAVLDGGLVVLYLGVLAVLSPRITAAVLLLGGLEVAVLLGARRSYRRLMSENLEATARVQGYEYQLLTGIETLKAAGAERRALDRWANLYAGEVGASLAIGRLQATVDAVLSTLRVGSPLCILVLGGFSVMSGALSLGTMLGAVALATGFLEPLSELTATGLQLQILGSYMDRIDDVLDSPREQEGRSVAPAPPLSGRIRAEHVCFAYTELAGHVIHDLCVEIEPGQHVAIVGASGSGKSTLASLLAGLYPPSSGRILYDGVDIRDLEVRSLRGQLGVVTQHPYLFSTTVRRNIALSEPDAGLDDVVAAARLACIDGDIGAMLGGYEAVLADAGATLSGGQRQRIALARALLRRPRILLLDEATSALDSETERRIYENLATLDCTAILIAHRLSTIVHADLILVMDGGRVVESGDHDELMRLGGRYRRFFDLQSAGGGVASPR